MVGSGSPLKAGAPRRWEKSHCQPSCSSPALMSGLSQPGDNRHGLAASRERGDSRERRCGTAGAGSDTRPGGREQVRISSTTTGGLWAAAGTSLVSH